MKRITLLAAAALLLTGSLGCHSNGCKTCGPHAGGGGVLGHGHLGQGHLGHGHAHGGCNVATGCRACKLGWQHGGLDYSEGLATHHPGHSFPGGQSAPYGGGRLGHHGAPVGQYGPAGPPTGAVAYPYYTTRGPRDFLLDNPPSIGR
ncbi:hypothetical protein [Candidatus Laterigemmans baculatus]|uniref:hypothetical protein n=1 Tax=Candidatus Laterigemmans baculatus TaxID=2770505 RepID=UPI0013D9757F|nr:hypothetical protein [Candidatus Laterigemmans baculatus]